jgi:hypothetical protein
MGDGGRGGKETEGPSKFSTFELTLETMTHIFILFSYCNKKPA